MQDFVTIVQSIGFPIAVAIAMFIMLQNEQKEHKQETERITETLNRLEMQFNDAIHQQETTVASAIDNNTLVIQKLIDKLDKAG